MSNEENVKVVKKIFAAIGSGDKQALLALVDEGIEWIIPGEDWPLAGTHRGHAGVAAVLRKAAEGIEMTYPKPPEFVAQGGRVLVVGVATEAAGRDEVVKMYLDMVPLGRLADPVEIENAAVFLGSEQSSYVTGAYLMADGGVGQV